MYVAGPPGGRGGDPLSISRAGRRVFEADSAEALHPDLRVFLSDLTRPYGLGPREDLLAAGAGQSYGEMSAALLTEVLPGGDPLDLIVLAFAMPDVRPERATASYLSHLCAGAPMGFAICDQGTAAAFTALRLIREYARSGACRRALLIIIEQAVLHHDLPAGGHGAVPARHAAVALSCDSAGPARVQEVRQHAAIAPERASAVLAADLADLGTPGGSLTLILGHDLARLTGLAERAAVPGFEAVTRVRIAPAGQPSTGVWWELACGTDWADPGELVLLADYEQALGYLSLSAIRYL
jgi:4-hydroxymandelate oxidase